MNEEDTFEEYPESIVLPAQKTGSRISGGTAILMILFGFTIDAVQLFLNLILIGIVLNYIIGLYTWLTFFIWLHWKGISMWEARVGMRILMGLLVAVGLEMFTAGAAPAWGLWAIFIVVTEQSKRAPVMGKIVKK